MPRLSVLLLLCACSNHLSGLSSLEEAAPGLDYSGSLDSDVVPYSPVTTEECASVRLEGKDSPQPVDILWAIDTSPSMAAEKAMVRTQLNRFSQHITDTGIDVNVVLIANASNQSGICIDAPLGSGLCPTDHNPPHLFRQYTWVGSHNALSRFVSEFDAYASTLRENSRKVYAVVTDDHSDWNAEVFSDARDAQDPKSIDDWTFYGFFCEAHDRGGVYTQLVEETEGTHIELCRSTPNWDSVFDEMAETVIQNNVVSCTLPIPEAPFSYTFEASKLNVDVVEATSTTSTRILKVADESACLGRDGWYYDSPTDPTSVHLCPTTCDTAQAHHDTAIDLWFGCTTEQY